MSEPMHAPHGGWLAASLASLALIGVVSMSSGSALDTLSIDLRHRWVALTAPDGGLDESGLGTPSIGMNVFLEQEVEPDKRQLSLDLLHAAGVTWIRQELPWEQIEPLGKGQTSDPNFGGSTWSKF
ncbi:MAG TPA: hypothetical protein VFB50_22240, partial [Chloroflexota bacterium]|nr:hypothetical protein [Chloroflexota bacterium]